jgi:hypothetical protein
MRRNTLSSLRFASVMYFIVHSCRTNPHFPRLARISEFSLGLTYFPIVAFPIGGRCQCANALTDEVCKAFLKSDNIVAFPVGEGGCTQYRRMRLEQV